jgi:hypothetical protein
MKGFLRVSVGLETTAPEVEALEQVFRWAEIPVLVEDELARFSLDSPWVMYLEAPLGWFASRFARVPEGAPTEELWPGLSTFVQQVAGAFRASDGSIVFTDEGSEVMIALTDRLPAEAFRELLAVDLPAVEGERISWNEEESAWYSLRGARCPRRPAHASRAPAAPGGPA